MSNEQSPRGRVGRGRFAKTEREERDSSDTLPRRTVLVRDVRPQVLLQVRVLVVVYPHEPMPGPLREVLHETGLPARRRPLQQDRVPAQQRRARERRQVRPHPRGDDVSTRRLRVLAFEVASLDPVLLDELVRVVGRRGRGFEYRLREETTTTKSLRNGVHHANAVVWEPVTTGGGGGRGSTERTRGGVRSRSSRSLTVVTFQ